MNEFLCGDTIKYCSLEQGNNVGFFISIERKNNLFFCSNITVFLKDIKTGERKRASADIITKSMKFYNIITTRLVLTEKCNNFI